LVRARDFAAWLRGGAPALPLIYLTIVTVCSCRAASAADSWCDHCDVQIGTGTTFRSWAWTDGLVLSLTLELDDSRWALGAFRFATAQRAPVGVLPGTPHAADPYWGFTVMRRWQVLHRGSGRLYVGFGANYRSEVDYLESTRWNFAYLIAVRVDLDAHGRALELGVHHWSDAWIRPPNRGENLLLLSFVF
jgi:Lipid A 3-O-deacylase (PagL)